MALVYDGECPFCANYVALMRLRERWPSIELVNAREQPDHPAVAEVKSAGRRIDDGMALLSGGTIYHGADALQVLAEHGGGLNRLLFASQRRARMFYPVLRSGRNLTLALLGRRKLGF